jgi:DNA-binding transcriptional LysR family regulator
MTDNKDLIDLNFEGLIFYHVALLHGFRAAATHLGLSKSVVSAKIADLEKRIGRKLLFRSTRDVSLTPEGERFFEVCKNLFLATQQLAKVEDEFKTGLSGVFTISAPHDFMTLKLIAMLREFQQLHPKLRLNLISSDQLLNLEKSKVDLAIRVGADGANHLYRSPFFDVEFGFFCQSKLFKSWSSPEDRLRKEGVLVFRPHRDRFFSLRGKEEALIIRNQFQVNDVVSLKNLVLDGAGIGILPIFAIERELESGELTRVLPTAVIKGVKYVFLSGSRRQEDERLDAVISFLQEQMNRPH